MAHPKSIYNSFWALGRSPWALLMEFLSRDQWCLSIHIPQGHIKLRELTCMMRLE